MIGKFFRLVRFGHTVFALPFAAVGYVYALRFGGGVFDWRVLLLMVAAMVFARNAAMGFNRLVDRDVDGANPRTLRREIPRGIVTVRAARWFVAVNAALFVLCACFINFSTAVLAPVALFVILGYSYTKRFTAWSHVVLGVGLAMAPVGAYMAVTGSVGLAILVLGAGVMTWVAGFDILYARADREFDRANGLHSVPARLGDRGAQVVSVLLHVLTAYCVVMFGLYTARGTVYWVGAGVFLALLILQHTRLRLPFDWVNGAASVIFSIFAVVDFYVA